MKIAHQLSALAGSTIVAMILIGFLGLYGQNASLQGLNTVYQDRVIPLKQLSDVTNAYAVNIVDTAQKLNSGILLWDQARINVSSARQEIETQWTAYRSTFLIEEEKQLVGQLEPLLQVADQAVDSLQQILQQEDALALSRFLQETLYQTIDPVTQILTQLASIQLDVAEAEYSQAASHYITNRNVMIATMLISLVMSIALSWYIIGGIKRSLGAEPNHVAEIAGRVAKGDLNIHIKVRSNDTNSVLFAMKQMTDNLSAIINNVRDSSRSIHVDSSQIASGNANLSARTEQQAASLAQIASSMEELTATVKQNADNSRHASDLTRGAASIAERGRGVVERVVHTMQDISESSHKVADITGVIDSIAFQTNILALNASVEAARAGEQGRGFAVVASEVRSLAQRSASAAKEIKELISDSMSKVQEGSTLAGQAGTTIKEIVTEVERVKNIMDEISAASQEQSDGIEQVSQAVGQMDQVTQQNASLVQDASSAASALENQADRLEQAVAIFQLTDSAQQDVTRESGTHLFPAYSTSTAALT